MKRKISLITLLLFSISLISTKIYLDLSESTEFTLSILIFLTNIVLTVLYGQNLRDSLNERKKNLTKKELP